MKNLIVFTLVLILGLFISGCDKKGPIEPDKARGNISDQALSAVPGSNEKVECSKITKLSFTGTEDLDAVSDPSRLLDPGTVVVKGDKIHVSGFTVLDDLTVTVEGMGTMVGNTKIVINALWDVQTYSGLTWGTFVKIFGGKEAWKGTFRSHRVKINDIEWKEYLDFEGDGVGDNEGMKMIGSSVLTADMPVPLRFSGPIKGEIIVPLHIKCVHNTF
jgi:predicted small lipoprotein YifL